MCSLVGYLCRIAASALVSLGTTEAKSGRGRGVKRANTEYSLRRQPAPSRRRQEKDDYVEPEYGMVAKQQYQGPGYDYEGRGAHLDQAHPGYGGAPGPAQQPYYAPPQGQAPQGFGRSVEADLLALLAQLSGTA